ncbi:hypothetical protein CRYUN_Cryun22dG0035200 [Craigia yunnanensis]
MTSTLIPKYCTEKPLSEVQHRNNYLWIWKNLPFGRDVCLKGMDIQVWGGNQSYIVDNSIKMVNKGSREGLPKLSQLICPLTHTWNTKKIDFQPNHDINQKVFMKALSVYGGQDRLVWKFNHRGDYSMKSAYHMLAKENGSAITQRFSSKVWEILWSPKIPFKLVIFLWKICNNCHPIRVELHKRIQNISPFFPMCLKAEESLEHLFFLRSLTRAVWFGTDLSIITEFFALTSIKDWIHNWLSKPELSGPDALWFYGQFVRTLWTLWKH